MSPFEPRHAPAGDVGAALMLIDSRLRTVHAGRSGADPEQEQLVRQLLSSLGPEGIDDVRAGTCTLIYLYTKWLREAHEAHEKDVVEYVVPTLVTSLKMLPMSVPPEAVPTMAGLVIAAATGLSPTLWRKQYGDWTEAELTPLEATAFLLAEHINRMTGDENFATCMVTQALTQVESGAE
ncbi:hypothetical protein [Streptomyces sp. NPDC017524]|uniref:hypothetical protein n=1 Tax=unclassified Streptomyces TaxID=2593676 RepID=UPI0037B18C60